MIDRYTRRDVEIAFGRLVEASGRMLGTNPGDWDLDHNHAGYVVIEVGDAGGGRYPLGPRRRRAREFCDTVASILGLLLREAAGEVGGPHTVYTFQSADGARLGFSTRNAGQARGYGLRTGSRVIAHHYQLSHSEPVWDFTRTGDKPDGDGAVLR
jgi:hypothetical protein